jgi:hypothetical protein
VKTAFPPGALVYLDGAHKVRVVSYWPEGSTSQAGAHYVVKETAGAPLRLTLTDRTGSATDLMPAPTQELRVAPNRLGVKLASAAASAPRNRKP